MTPEDFVRAIERVAYAGAVEGTLDGLAGPPVGQGPHKRAVALQGWYAALSDEDRRAVREIVRDTAHFAVFQFLCVLDQVVAVDDPPHAELRLTAIDAEGTEHALNDSSPELHDLFNELVHPPSETWEDSG